MKISDIDQCHVRIILHILTSHLVASKQAPKPEIQMWGFGSPRVGNIPFAEHYDELVFNTWRISNLNDIVTKCVTVPSIKPQILNQNRKDLACFNYILKKGYKVCTFFCFHLKDNKNWQKTYYSN